MLGKIIKRGCKLGYSQINPGKHNYIRAPNDPRKNHAWLGRVFVPKRVARQESEEKYVNPSVSIIFNYLKNKYPQFVYELKDYDKIKNNTFFVYDINLKEEKDNILDLLSENLVLKNHQYRHSIEKVKRREMSNFFQFDEINLGELSIKEFFEFYSEFCEILVQDSRKFNEVCSDLDFTKLEEMYNQGENKGLTMERHNNNFINRLMQWMHS